MANLTDLLELAAAARPEYVQFDRGRCLHVRNHASHCRRCRDACPHNALGFTYKQGPYLNMDACTNCGACITACPTQALAAYEPTDAALLTRTAHAVAHAEGVALFACARATALQPVNADKVAEVPCLAHLDESLLLDVASHGISRIALIDGACATCKNRGCGEIIGKTVEHVNEMLGVFPGTTRIQRASSFPTDIDLATEEVELGQERRDLLAHTKDYATSTLTRMAQTAIRTRWGGNTVADADLPPLVGAPMPRHERLLDALGRLGDEPADQQLSTTAFAHVGITKELCSGCRKCTLVCPGQALTFSALPESLKPDASCDYLEFCASKCLGCNMCKDVCPRSAIALYAANAREIFDFEPRLIPVPKKFDIAAQLGLSSS